MFAAGVVSGKTHAHGTLKGTGTPLCKVDFVAFEDKVEVGDWFYTSGDDRIFPRGMPVGVVKSVKPGQPYREITIDPSGMSRGGPEDVLIVVEGVHQEIPDAPPANQQVYLAPPPPAIGGACGSGRSSRRIGAAAIPGACGARNRGRQRACLVSENRGFRGHRAGRRAKRPEHQETARFHQDSSGSPDCGTRAWTSRASRGAGAEEGNRAAHAGQRDRAG
jgi:hypothetical protein